MFLISTNQTFFWFQKYNKIVFSLYSQKQVFENRKQKLLPNNSLLEKTGEYARVAKAAINKMKKAEQDYKSLLMRYKETKCEVKMLNGELTEAYSKIEFLELEVIQVDAKV